MGAGDGLVCFVLVFVCGNVCDCVFICVRASVHVMAENSHVLKVTNYIGILIKMKVAIFLSPERKQAMVISSQHKFCNFTIFSPLQNPLKNNESSAVVKNTCIALTVGFGEIFGFFFKK